MEDSVSNYSDAFLHYSSHKRARWSRCESSIAGSLFRDSWVQNFVGNSTYVLVCESIELHMIFIPDVNTRLIWWAQHYSFYCDWISFPRFCYSVWIWSLLNLKPIPLITEHLFVSHSKAVLVYWWSQSHNEEVQISWPFFMFKYVGQHSILI